MKRIGAALATALLAVGLAAFSGAARAGNPHGGPGGPGPQAPPPAAQPGDPGPGHGPQRPDQQAQQATQQQPAPQSPSHDHGNKHDEQQAAQPTTPAPRTTPPQTAGPAPGVKPTPAGSTSTKLYGNGQTAGKIAQGKGASPSTDLYGPGNSQPHKIKDCRGHEVDVHAYRGASSCSTEASGGTMTTTTTSAGPGAMVSFCDMTSATTGAYETKPAAEVVRHELNGTPEEARDIVPPFSYDGQTYSQRWDANGQAIFNAHCNLALSGAQAATTSTAQVTTTVPGTTTQQQQQQQTVTQQQLTVTQQQQQTATQQHQTRPRHTTTTQSQPQHTVTTIIPGPAVTGGVQGTRHTLHHAARAQPVTVTTASGGVAGATYTSSPKHSGGVLGSTLPFTGIPLWIVLLAALALIVAGVFARLSAREP